MAWTQDDVDTLKAAIATGAQDVQYSDGSRTTYRSLKDMRDTLAMMQSEVDAAAQPTRRTYRAVRVTPRSGY
ncbi:phage head-tail joining protein [Azospirillum brasilense]|uniref:GpW protein n=1 Tax=Azospirillum brasilense TaxID=192 RepID=A0A235H580_AZOBR|nr:hypothetical protein [Azospirillum brasilense]OYD80948.1 hypothetical protein CHT98_28540 [Azospirillum brasilense]